MQIHRVEGNGAFETGRILHILQLVECVGHMYGVIHAGHDDFLYQHYRDEDRQNIWENVATPG